MQQCKSLFMDIVHTPALQDPQMETIQGLGKFLYQEELLEWDTVYSQGK